MTRYPTVRRGVDTPSPECSTVLATTCPCVRSARLRKPSRRTRTTGAEPASTTPTSVTRDAMTTSMSPPPRGGEPRAEDGTGDGAEQRRPEVQQPGRPLAARPGRDGDQ